MKRVLPIVLVFCLLFTGCLDYGEDPNVATPPPTVAPSPTIPSTPVTAQEGGTLRLSMRAPQTLNPLLNEDATVDRVLKLIFEPLTVLDDTLKPTSNLASLNFSSDYTSVTLTLREDVIWSDGTPLSADDVLFSIEFLQNAPEGAIYKHQVDNIASCTKLGNKTVKITFVEVFGGSGYLFNFPVIPKHYYKNENNPSSVKNMAPLGNGFFMFESYSAMKSMTLTNSPYCFRGQAYIEKVEALVIPDFETELNAFDQGLIDVISLELTEWSRHHSVKQTRYGEYDAMYYEFIGFNFNREILQNKLFREALAHAVNLEELIPAVYLTHATRTLSPVNPASWVYDAGVPVYAYDMEKAKALITQIQNSPTETGEPTDNEAIDGETAESETTESKTEIPALSILVNEENDERVKIAESLAESMRQLGLEVQLEKVPFTAMTERLTAGDYDIFISGYNLSVIPDLRFALHSDGEASGGNLFAYRDPVMDRLLGTAFSAGTENAYIKALSNVQQYIAAELPVISLAFRKSAVLTDTRIYGEIKPSADNIFANVNEWYLAE